MSTADEARWRQLLLPSAAPEVPEDGTVEGPTVGGRIADFGKNHPVLTLGGVAIMLVNIGIVNIAAQREPQAIPVDVSTIDGTWSSSDGAEPKIFDATGEQCRGFYYHEGTTRDIAAQCSIATRNDGANRYTLQVSQTEPKRYTVQFSDHNHAAVYDCHGHLLYELSRS